MYGREYVIMHIYVYNQLTMIRCPVYVYCKFKGRIYICKLWTAVRGVPYHSDRSAMTTQTHTVYRSIIDQLTHFWWSQETNLASVYAQCV
jgi:hypothetical protein